MKQLFNSIIKTESEIGNDPRIKRINALAVLVWLSSPKSFEKSPLIYPETLVFHDEYEEFKPISRKTPKINPIGDQIIQDQAINQQIKTLCNKYKDTKTKELIIELNNQTGNVNTFENYYTTFKAS